MEVTQMMNSLFQSKIGGNPKVTAIQNATNQHL